MGDVWHMPIGRRRPGVPLSAPSCPTPSGIAWAASDPLPRPSGGGVLARAPGSGRLGRCLGTHVPLALAHQRLNRTLFERIQVFVHESRLPQSLWGKSLRHALWLKNCTATCVQDGKTPFEALYGQPPNLQNLWIWGCQVWVHSPGGPSWIHV